MMIFLTGCTSKEVTKTVIVYPEPFKFVKIDVNLTEIKPIPTLSLTGKVSYTDKTKKKVQMETKVWKAIRTVSKEKTKVINVQELQIKSIQEALAETLWQVDLYNQTIKDRNDTKID